MDEVRRRSAFALFISLWLLVPVSVLAVLPMHATAALTPHPTGGDEYSGFTLFINSTKQGMINFTAEEFMALDSVTGWATPEGEPKAKIKGVNFTWFAVTYGDWGNLSAKLIAVDDFTQTHDESTVVSNATHCHVLAYEYNDRLMTDEYQLWFIPITIVDGGDSPFNAGFAPRMIDEIQIIGLAEAAGSELAILMFIVTVVGAIVAVGVVLVALYMWSSRRKSS